MLPREILIASIYPYPWGDEAPGTATLEPPNVAQSSDCSPAGSVEVGSFGPSSIGLFDMAGNVWEWVYDWYGVSGYYSNSPPYNPQGPDTGTDKVSGVASFNYMALGLPVFTVISKNRALPVAGTM